MQDGLLCQNAYIQRIVVSVNPWPADLFRRERGHSWAAIRLWNQPVEARHLI
jgi:hypothetical protein